MEKTKKKKVKTEEDKPKGLSTGSTLLNLACSNKTAYGLIPGQYYLFVGDTNSGKTWFSRTILAEAAINPLFDKYRFIFDDVEGGSLMDTARFFGSKLKERLEAPSYDNENEPIHSSTIEEFYYHIDNATDKGKPFIYILDSIDSLSSEDEEKKFLEHKKAYLKSSSKDDDEEGEAGEEKKPKGSYGDGKAKKNSAYLRRVISRLRKSESILIIINQTRDNIGFGAMFNPKTRSGGHALVFYACVQLWTSCKMNLKRTVNGKDRQLGLISKIHVKRSRLTGKDRTIEVPIYHSYGIDDLGSMVEYLKNEKHWKGNKKTVVAPEFEYSGKTEGLIAKIEEGNREKELRRIVANKWRDIELECEVKRKKRYT